MSIAESSVLARQSAVFSPAHGLLLVLNPPLALPEELMAAAHAACYAMALNATLGRKQASAERTVVTAKISADRGDAGITITTSELTVTAYGLKGVEAGQFQAVAEEAEGKCPVSNAYRGSMQITVKASVA